jgi:hypothetical protein
MREIRRAHARGHVLIGIRPKGDYGTTYRFYFLFYPICFTERGCVCEALYLWGVSSLTDRIDICNRNISSLPRTKIYQNNFSSRSTLSSEAGHFHLSEKCQPLRWS